MTERRGRPAGSTANSTREKIITFVRENQPCTRPEISKALGVGPSATKAHLKKLADAGLLFRAGVVPDTNDRRQLALWTTRSDQGYAPRRFEDRRSQILEAVSREPMTTAGLQAVLGLHFARVCSLVKELRSELKVVRWQLTKSNLPVAVYGLADGSPDAPRPMSATRLAEEKLRARLRAKKANVELVVEKQRLWTGPILTQFAGGKNPWLTA